MTGEVKKAIFLVVDRHCELILCLLTSPKCDLDEGEKVIIQDVECRFQVIFWYLTSRNSSISSR